MIPEYSIDDGKTFLLAGPRLTFTPPLAKTLAVGLAICATDRSQVTTASFSGLLVRKL